MNNTQNFIAFVKQECNTHGIKLSLRKSRYLKLTGNIKCSGYFDDIEKILVVATNRPDWLAILVHEYAHLTQWVENCKPWKDLGDSINRVDDWLTGEAVEGIKDALAKCRDLELDNEKRAAKIIKEWGLPIDIKVYVQKANAYVQLYNYMYISRRWPKPGNSPYSNPAVYQSMPTIFKMNYKNISKKYIRVFEEAGL